VQQIQQQMDQRQGYFDCMLITRQKMLLETVLLGDYLLCPLLSAADNNKSTYADWMECAADAPET